MRLLGISSSSFEAPGRDLMKIETFGSMIGRGWRLLHKIWRVRTDLNFRTIKGIE